ncbi:hypothetical protein H9P43_009083 [Blastocladiella emersonii ATCC 22665]|nr:hypothetical protein H9P43_009083 [Blastocladiella emersonii ATCC 22665]
MGSHCARCRRSRPVPADQDDWPLTVEHVAETSDLIELTLRFTPGALTKFGLLSKSDAKYERGAVTILVDGVRQTMRVSTPVFITNVQIARKQGRVMLSLKRIMNGSSAAGLAHAPLHIGRTVPASPNSRLLTHAISAFMHSARDLVHSLHPSAPRTLRDGESMLRLLKLDPANTPAKRAAAGVVELTRELFDAYSAGIEIVSLRRSTGEPRSAVRELPWEALLPMCQIPLYAMPSSAAAVSDSDPRVDAPTYVALRKVMKRVLVLPAYPVGCGQGIDTLGPLYQEFMLLGI